MDFPSCIVGGVVSGLIVFAFFKLKNEGELSKTTRLLRQALTHQQVRGQWGERMVEDILRPVGLLEGRHYLKQTTIPGAQGRPDYTFLLPRGKKVNLDSKFPFNNYLAMLEADSDVERASYQKKFVADVRAKLKEVTARGYINPEDKTLDFVLLFIPNEQLFSFAVEKDKNLFDEAMENKVVLCSPWTLYPVLSVIRHAIDNFIFDKNTGRFLEVLGDFFEQWETYKSVAGEVRRAIDKADQSLSTLEKARTNKLDKVRDRMEEIKNAIDFHSENGD
jgi:DNA recombination protein RmuC